MTSWFATTSNQLLALSSSKTVPLMGYKRTGYPVEGQVPVTFAPLSGTIAAGTFNNFNEINTLASATAITLSDTDLKNLVGKIIIFQSNGGASGPTITLSNSSVGKYNGGSGATHIATFTNSVVGTLVLAVSATSTSIGAAGTPLVNVIVATNVTLS